MSQSEEFDKRKGENDFTESTSDPYRSESSADIYNTPDLFSDWQQKQTEDTADEEETAGEEDAGPEAITLPETETDAGEAVNDVSQSRYSDGDGSSCGDSLQQGYNNESPYGDSPQQGYSSSYGAPQYNNESPYGDSPQQGYGSSYGAPQYNNDSLSGDSPQQGYSSPYGAPQYNNESPYSGSPQQGYGSPYGGPQYNNGSSYNGSPQEGYDSPYGSPQHNNGSPQQGYGSPYGGPQYNNGSPYNGNPQWNNPYSPYAVPQKKNQTGLIIGSVPAVVVLFLIAVSALVYKAVNLFAEKESKRRTYQEDDFGDRQEDYYDFDDDEIDPYDSFDDDFFEDYDDPYDPDGFYGDDFYWDGQYPFNFDDFDGYDDGYDFDDYDDGYYNLHDDVKTDLPYSVEFEDFEYDADYDNVMINVTYPVIKGENVPNLDKLNQTIQAEKDFFTEYFEEEYKDHMTEEYSYFSAQSKGYVTYMDEEKMSIVFSEYIYSDYYNDVYLYCINIDMENGIILNNENLLNINDDFSVEFRQKSDIQNDEITYLTRMTDQEMTKLFNSSDVIVFYTPMGMEIGFNYEEGWVTVTYEEYEKYLKVL